MKKMYSVFSILFCYSCLEAQYVQLFDFANPSDGNLPSGDLFYDGSQLYGMTCCGGANFLGDIFKINTDGTGFVKLFDFDGSISGSLPKGSLISDGLFLYGMTSTGGSSDLGVIFKIKSDGTGFTKLLDFDGLNYGSNPKGSLIYDGTFLYGVTQGGGFCGGGVVFKVMTDGSGFSDISCGFYYDGANPTGSLILDGAFLYGMSEHGGGINDYGNIFKLKIDGTTGSTILDFDDNFNGKYPRGSLIYDGVFLYGMAYEGGANNEGTLIKIKPDGTGYSKLLDFDGIFGNGSYPCGSLISDGNFLYGMNWGGGSGLCGTGCGTIFRIRFDGTSYSKLLDFGVGNNSAKPQSSLIIVGNCLFGMTTEGGNAGSGTIFKFCNFNSVNPSIKINNYKLTLSPNPATTVFTIENSKFKTGETDEVEIRNVLGQLCQSSIVNGQSSSVSISTLPAGIYFVQLKTKVGIASGKLVKQ